MALCNPVLVKKLWPFSIHKTNGDLKASDGLVHGLPIPDQTKQFVFAVRDPETQAVIYLLAAQNLSEQYALDAKYLIKEVQLEAIVVHIALLALSQIQAEENDLSDVPIPTSAFGVLKSCFINMTRRQQYENIAGGQVLWDIFGVGFYGHLLSAKGTVNNEVNATFLCLKSSCVITCVDSREEIDFGNSATTHILQPSNLHPRNVTPAISLSARRLCLNNELQFQMVKLLSSSLTLSLSNGISVSVGNSVLFTITNISGK